MHLYLYTVVQVKFSVKNILSFTKLIAWIKPYIRHTTCFNENFYHDFFHVQLLILPELWYHTSVLVVFLTLLNLKHMFN